MKKCLCFCLTLLLLLPGCKKTDKSGVPSAAEPVTTGLYDPEHPVEQQTVGAVRAYPLGGNNYIGLTVMGSKLLLLKDDGSALVLQGENCEVMADGPVGLESLFDTNYGINSQGVAVYEEETHQVVLMNPQLQVVNRIQLPQDMQGAPMISLQSNEIFYCMPGEIRALNMESNVPRLLKSHTAETQTLTGCYFDGTVLRWETTNADGEVSVQYLSAEDGMTLREDPNIFTFVTCGERYFIQRLDNMVTQNVVGTLENGANSLALPEEEVYALADALSMNGMVSYRLTEAGVELSFHDLAKEQTTAKLVLPDIQEPVDVIANEQYVWMIVSEGAQQVLYRWDVEKSSLEEAVSVIAPLYTPQAPDTQGLEACQTLAKQYLADYGVQIHIWEDAGKETGDHTVVLEHQPAIITFMLTSLEPVLQQFPEAFLRTTVRSGWVRVGLVRSIGTGEDWVQFWAGGDCYILISSQADVSQAFLEAIGYGIDSHVLGNSRDYDTWSQLNPEGFSYGAAEYDPAILEGETRAFVNEFSLETPSEDRRQLFIAAMTEGNQDMFTSEIMQNKLRRMCEGIREAYGLEKKKELYLWEQYLNEPMVEVEQTNG